MKKSFVRLLFPLALSFLSTVFLPPGPAASEAGPADIKVMKKEGIGAFLADGRGMALYSFARDKVNTSNCIEGCAVNWPPFGADLAKIGKGLAAKNFATITRSDGRQQTTYKGMPLYYFINDKYPGDTFGQGLGDAWFLVTP